MNFDFAFPQRILFGAGLIRQAGPMARNLGCRALVVTGRDPARAALLLDLLRAEGIAVHVFPVRGEPTTDVVRQGTAQALDFGADFIVGFGGGSPLDTAKAIAVMATNGGDPLDYLEVVGRGQTLAKAALPMLAIPTTAGTGSEVTRNAVLASPEHKVKASLRSPSMIPRAAIVDPELTYGMPPAVTASTGLDALTQLIEPFTCNRTNPLIDGFCRDGIARVARSLRRAWANGHDAAAREDMALASLYSGLALANAGLGVVHGFAGVVGGAFMAPHGAVCAALLPHVMAVNRRVLQERAPDSPLAARYEEVARLLMGDPAASADEGVAWVAQLARDLEVPSLAACGVKGEHVPLIVERAAVASGTKANPIALTSAELAEILQRAL